MAIQVLLKNGSTLEFERGNLVDPGNSQSGIVVITQGRELGYQVIALLNTAEILAVYDSGVGRLIPAPAAS